VRVCSFPLCIISRLFLQVLAAAYEAGQAAAEGLTPQRVLHTGLVLSILYMMYGIHTGGRRGGRILPNSRALVLHQGGQRRLARGMQGWLIRAQKHRSKRISCEGQVVTAPRRPPSVYRCLRPTRLGRPPQKQRREATAAATKAAARVAAVVVEAKAVVAMAAAARAAVARAGRLKARRRRPRRPHHPRAPSVPSLPTPRAHRYLPSGGPHRYLPTRHAARPRHRPRHRSLSRAILLRRRARARRRPPRRRPRHRRVTTSRAISLRRRVRARRRPPRCRPRRRPRHRVTTHRVPREATQGQRRWWELQGPARGP